jgi:flagellin
MALGVLNNLSAIYAENNLNNTNNSLQEVLQQLSSGSRINSGADDAAGLSLVNGLGANSAALTQSETNATEGVGLLQVADGALSQVTSLLNRAITLATEASNGTLNSSQDAAANQEYQSILSEINNIGSTTTFNQQQVFNGESVAIYTGDSSTTGSSIDDLYLRSLSESSVGDSGGVMSYSNGQDNVFLNLSTATANAAITDTLNTSGQTTVDVNYLVNGANGEKTTASTQISVGSGTSYANTVSGLISAINDAGLGLTATFATQQAAGVTGGGAETGIEITGGLLSAGFAPSSVSTNGMLNQSGIPASELLTQGQTVTVTQNGNTIGSVTVNPSINTLQELANAINTGTGSGVTGFTGTEVNATVVTNGDGTQSLSLTDENASDGTLAVNISGGNGTAAPVFGVPTTGTNAPALGVLAGTSSSGTAQVIGQNGSVTLGTSGTNSTNDVLTAQSSVTLTNTGTGEALTFVVGTGVDGGGKIYTANHAGAGNTYTVQGLIQTINAESGVLGATATFDSSDNNGFTVAANSAASGTNIVASANTLTQANNLMGLYNPTLGGAGVYATAILQLDPGDPNLTVIDDANDSLTGSVTLKSNNVSETFVMGTGINTGSGNGATICTGANTVASLVSAINGQNAVGDLDLSASDPGSGSGAIYLQAGTTGAAYNISMTASTLADVGSTADGDSLAEDQVATTNGRTAVTGVDSSVSVGVGGGGLNTSDVLTAGGNIAITYDGTTDTFYVGSGTNDSTTGTYYTANSGDGSNTLANLAATITDSGLGVTAVANTSGLTLTSNAALGDAISASTSGLSDATQGTYANVMLGTFASESDSVNGTMNFAVGGVEKSLTLNAGSTVASMIKQINQANLGVQAAWAATSNGFGNVVLTSSTEGAAGQITSPLAALTDTTATANLTYAAGEPYDTGLTSSPSNVVYDSTTGQNGTTGAATFISDARSGSGIATISYSDGSGEPLNGTDLTNENDAETALNKLNVAISDVAAQDGYIGAQINTLNALSQVMSTQQENVVSAQNAIQATDYASATSNMSKYEVLSQTGIAALAQANQVQQEVTKLLQ